MPAKLRLADFQAAAATLGCEVAAIQAIAAVEGSRWGGFFDDGQPTLLYERHLFHRFTQGRHDGAKLLGVDWRYAELSDADPGGYGPTSLQHLKLRTAAKLDRAAALRCCSWGRFQVLGDNWKRCGFSSLQDFVNAMYSGEAGHLRAFVGYISSSFTLAAALRAKNWRTVARLYNGEEYEAHGYHLALAREYAAAVA